MEVVSFEPDFDSWRIVARGLLHRGVAPASVVWKPKNDEQFELVGESMGISESPRGPNVLPSLPRELRVPPRFIEEARFVAAHRNEAKWPLLYGILWRLTQGEPEALVDSIDPDVARFRSYFASVRRDLHKMKAFVRFKEVRDEEDGLLRYVAWHSPDHRIVRLVSEFFRDRFQSMRWSILTEDESVHWDGKELEFTPGVPRRLAPAGDDVESLWRAYYSAIFNPARLKIRAMKKEMAVRYWSTLPEAALIPELIRGAAKRLEEFREHQKPDAAAFFPIDHSSRFFRGKSAPAATAPETSDEPLSREERLRSLGEAARSCRACDLCERGTQTVFGEGNPRARIVIVGEQPGHEEDLEGKPFVGPAGQLFDEALRDADIDRKDLYVTNAVKHFRWTPSGKLRLHQKPSGAHVSACDPWLREEVEIVRPDIVVCLGVTAAQSFLGKSARLLDVRGKFIETPRCAKTFFTIHPSAILRTEDARARAIEYERFVADLRVVLEESRKGNERAP